MEIISDKQKRFFGNLHCHSTRSDGKSEVNDLVNAYKNEGYHFLAITDHRKALNTKEYDTKDFILIPGMEMDTWVHPNSKHQFFHFQVLGEVPHDFYVDTPVFSDYVSSMEPYNDYSNYIRILNHPHWSRMDVEYIKLLKPDIMEIYNHSAEVTTTTGYDLTTWDQLLHAGIIVNGVATDDNHQDVTKNNPVRDYFGGVTVVLGETLSREEIFKQLKAGNFYSKQTVNGPDFIKVVYENNVIKVWTKDVSKIKFIAFNYHGDTIYRTDVPLEYGEFKCEGHILVRIEIEDDQGLKAWSNPITTITKK